MVRTGRDTFITASVCLRLNKGSCFGAKVLLTILMIILAVCVQRKSNRLVARTGFKKKLNFNQWSIPFRFLIPITNLVRP